MRPGRMPRLRRSRSHLGGANQASRDSSFAAVKNLDHALKKLRRGRAVNYPMVERKTEEHHRSPRDLAAIHRGLIDYSSDSENTSLAGIQNWRERVDTPCPEVGDREAAAGNVFELKMTGACLLAERAAFDRDIAKR